MSLGTPKPAYKYRAWRRNHSDLNRDTKDWFGVEPDRFSTHPAFMKRVSARGEVHYTKAKEQVRREGLPSAQES